jgi:hypothetical protein
MTMTLFAVGNQIRTGWAYRKKKVGVGNTDKVNPARLHYP